MPENKNPSDKDRQPSTDKPGDPKKGQVGQDQDVARRQQKQGQPGEEPHRRPQKQDQQQRGSERSQQQQGQPWDPGQERGIPKDPSQQPGVIEQDRSRMSEGRAGEDKGIDVKEERGSSRDQPKGQETAKPHKP